MSSRAGRIAALFGNAARMKRAVDGLAMAIALRGEGAARGAMRAPIASGAVAIGAAAMSDGVLEVFVFLAFVRAADLGDRLQLVAREVVLALNHVGFAEILAHLRVVQVHRHRLEIIADAFVGAASLRVA